MTVLGEFLPDGSDGLDDRKGAKEVATTLTIFLTKGHLRRLEQVQIPVWCYSQPLRRSVRLHFGQGTALVGRFSRRAS